MLETHNLTEKMYADYVEVPRILKFVSYFQFIPPIEFLQKSQIFREPARMSRELMS